MNIFYFSDIPQYSYQKYHKTSNVFKEKNETYSHLYIYKQQIFIYFFNVQTPMQNINKLTLLIPMQNINKLTHKFLKSNI